MKHLILLLLATGVWAQPVTFETASIKPTPPGAHNSVIAPMPGGGVNAEGISLKNLMMWAFDVQDYQISGGPSWVESQPWTILAKPAPSAAANSHDGPIEYEKMNAAQQAQYMRSVQERTRALLAGRFQLVLRREEREQTAYVLTVAKGGPKMKESAPGMIRRGNGEILSKGSQMGSFVRFLAVDLRRPVTDATGLTGTYEFDLKWTPDRPANTESGAATANDPAGPTIFTAIEEQLGLRLEARKAPVGTLIIERVDKPSDN
ncbi:MAG: TIGR03435 family protein [Bryobacteraceae bacterium]